MKGIVTLNSNYHKAAYHQFVALKMAKTSEVLRTILFIFMLQVPLFIGLLKLAELKGVDKNNLISAATGGRALSLGSLNITGPSLMGDIESSALSDCSAAAVASQGDIKSVAAFRPMSVAHYPFVLFSVYRLKLNSFYLLGTTSVIVRQHENQRPVYRCEWLPGGGNDSANSSEGAQEPSSNREDTIVTEPTILYVWFDENGESYVPAIINCTFNQSVGADGKGGLLRLHLSKGPSFWEPHYAVEDVFMERPGEVNEKMLRDEADESSSVAEELRYKYAFCGPPLYGTTHNIDWIPKWLAYHHYLWEGKAHFYFYAAESFDTATRQMLEPWIEAGLVTVIEALGGEEYPSWYRNQLLFINDCIYRTRFTARWSFFHDLDEMLYVPAPNTLASLLEEHADKPWMTFGNLPFSTDLCRTTLKSQQKSPEEEEWQVERLLWHSKLPECTHDWEDPWMCVAAPGRRKFVVNPRKVFLSGVHRVALPEEGGLDFNASVARVHHFHGITNPHMTACNHLVNMSAESEQPDPLSYEFDDAMASVFLKVRTFAGPLLRPPQSPT